MAHNAKLDGMPTRARRGRTSRRYHHRPVTGVWVQRDEGTHQMAEPLVVPVATGTFSGVVRWLLQRLMSAEPGVRQSQIESAVAKVVEEHRRLRVKGPDDTEAVLVSADELRELDEALEDLEDIQAAEAALASDEPLVPWEKIQQDLGL